MCVCSLHVVTVRSRASACRHRDCPLGVEPRSMKVRDANKQVSLMCMCLLWLEACKCSWIVEQPATSIMIYHPRFQQVKASCGASFREIDTFMGSFGGPSVKPTKLYSSSAYVETLKRPMPRHGIQGEQLVARDEVTGAVTGIADALKGSQAYPPDYAAAVAEAFCDAQQVVDNGDASDSDESAPDPTDMWEDCGLQDACDWLSVPADRMLH